MPKTVQLSEDAYRTLRAVKQPGESFSDTVKRLIAERKDPLGLLRLPPPARWYDYEHVRRMTRRADMRRWRELGLWPPRTRRRTR